MNLEQYESYSTDDFILDEEFRQIVKSPECKLRINELKQAFPDRAKDINLAVRIIRNLRPKNTEQSDERKQEQWQQIKFGEKKRVRMVYFRYAASFILIVGLAGSFFYLKNEKTQVAETTPVSYPSNDALLILSDGKTVPISTKKSTIQYSPDGSGITVNDSSGIAQPQAIKGLNQLIVPYGKRSFITLSEGTKVWLNSGSKLIFPPVFDGNKREVTLEGEGFFEVTPDKKKPFLVKTNAFTMKVYGTKFNVQAYNQDQAYSIVLVEGKVGMNTNEKNQSSEVFLAPNQKALISKGEKTFDITEVENMEIYTAWVDGYLTFANEDISILLKKISRYYNVDIESELPEDWEKIYGKLDLKEDLERVLDGVAFISKSRYEKRDNKYIFSSNEQ